MEELISRVAAAAGIDAATAQKAVAIILQFLEKEGPKTEVADMLDAIPGAREAMAAEAAAPAKSGGLMGGLLGALGGGGGLMALAGKLSSAGLGMGEMKSVGKELFRYAREHVGEEKLKDIAAKTPGLSQMI
jgi:predicted lipid-binding transport protein (Tim44 family)